MASVVTLTQVPGVVKSQTLRIGLQAKMIDSSPLMKTQVTKMPMPYIDHLRDLETEKRRRYRRTMEIFTAVLAPKYIMS